jgi:hypothetical protein
MCSTASSTPFAISGESAARTFSRMLAIARPNGDSSSSSWRERAMKRASASESVRRTGRRNGSAKRIVTRSPSISRSTRSTGE